MNDSPEAKSAGQSPKRAAANSTASKNTIETFGRRTSEVSTRPATVASATAAADHMKGKLTPVTPANWRADEAVIPRLPPRGPLVLGCQDGRYAPAMTLM